MTDRRAFHYSMIEFRKNPADRDAGAVPLGVAIGFTTDSYRVLGLAIREPIESAFLDDLDPLSKRMIENRSMILEHEIRLALQTESTPDRVLMAIANRNPWSIHVAQPAEMVIDVGQANSASIEGTALDYVFTLYRQRLVPTRSTVLAQVPHAHSYAFDRSTHVSVDPDTPPAWMLPPKVWYSPKVGC